MTNAKMPAKKRTDLITFENGDAFRIYKDESGKLYYRRFGFWHSTFIEYCEKGRPTSAYKR